MNQYQWGQYPPHGPYGQNPQYSNQNPFGGPPPQQPRTTMAGIALALGILTVIFPMPVLGVITGALGIIFSAISRKSGVGGLAVGALVVSIIGTALTLFITVILFVVGFGAFDAVLNERSIL